MRGLCLRSQPCTQGGCRAILDELLTKLMDHRVIRANSNVRARLLKAGATMPEGAKVEDCLYMANRVRDRYKQCKKLPLNSNARRIALQSLYTTVAPKSGHSMLNGILRILGTTSRETRVGLRRGAKRIEELCKHFADAGKYSLTETVTRNLALTGGGTYSGARRASPRLSEDQRRSRKWAEMIWSVDKTPMKGFLRVSPTTRDAVRYRSDHQSVRQQHVSHTHNPKFLLV